MHDENRELLKASHPQGDYKLRTHIAKYLHEYRGVNCLPEQIIIGAGTEYLLGFLVQMLGTSVVYGVENPGYLKTYKVLKSNRANVEAITLDDEGMSIQSLKKSDVNIAYITPSHHFPLGIVMPINRRMQLLKWANEKTDRYIIEDDYDSEFRYNGRPIPALQGLDTNQKVIYMSTFSKSIAPSIRISYMVLPPSLLHVYQSYFMFYSCTVPRFEQYTLYKFISGGYFERHLNKMRNIYKTRKEKLVTELEKLSFSDKIEIQGKNAGLHLLLKINSCLDENELISLAKTYGVKLYGLSDYYIEGVDGMPDNIVILGYSNFDMDEIQEAACLLEQSWSKVFD
jgi:GntR family transcriptional regulator/MocR family aminotransferase